MENTYMHQTSSGFFSNPILFNHLIQYDKSLQNDRTFLQMVLVYWIPMIQWVTETKTTIDLIVVNIEFLVSIKLIFLSS